MENKSQRYVGRVALSRPFRRRRVVAGVATGRQPRTSAGKAQVARGVAKPIDSATEVLQPPDITAAIFVDGSGRRGRRLRRAAYALVALALVLLLAFWVMQGVDAFGSSA